jgi:hypothetical protein
MKYVTIIRVKNAVFWDVLRVWILLELSFRRKDLPPSLNISTLMMETKYSS